MAELFEVLGLFILWIVVGWSVVALIGFFNYMVSGRERK